MVNEWMNTQDSHVRTCRLCSAQLQAVLFVWTTVLLLCDG
jgi:hypothetical protein